MKAHVLHEPQLEFRTGNRHIDPRYGISAYGPADAESPSAPRQIPIALIGPSQAVDGIRSWLQRCREQIEAKDAKPGQENLHQPFPGFSPDSEFGSELVFDDALVREISERQLRRLARADTASATAEAVEIYADAARSLAETGRCRVIVCARPEELLDRETRPPAAEDDGADHDEEPDERESSGDFHDLLKAAALTLAAPLQLMRKETWTGQPTKNNGQAARPLQDEATRAWNLHTALYYKAGGTPWRMQRHTSDLATCYVGISFYRSTSGQELHTAVAQVFNERGDGVVVRGGTAQISKIDRQPHLAQADARRLLLDALAEYRGVRHFPQPHARFSGLYLICSEEQTSSHLRPITGIGFGLAHGSGHDCPGSTTTPGKESPNEPGDHDALRPRGVGDRAKRRRVGRSPRRSRRRSAVSAAHVTVSLESTDQEAHPGDHGRRRSPRYSRPPPARNVPSATAWAVLIVSPTVRRAARIPAVVDSTRRAPGQSSRRGRH